MTLTTIRFIRVSSNRKTGPIPVTSSEALSCSPVCPFNLDEEGNVKTEKAPSVTCATCGLCQLSERDYIIGFRAHGTAKNKTDIIARG